MSTNQNQGATIAAVALTGIHQMSAFFDPMGDAFAQFVKNQFLPDGTHYVKLTDAGSGNTKIVFCDASGNTSGFNPGTPPSSFGDFAAGTTKHYWKNNMPMALAFQDVTFTFDDTTGDITNANGVHALARRNGNGTIPSWIPFVDQDSDSSAAIITTTGNSASAFSIRVKLGFTIPFQVVLSKI